MKKQRNGLRSSSTLVYDKEKSPLVHHWTERRAGEAPWEQGSFITRIVRVDNDKNDKVLEVDTGRPSITPVPRNIVHSSQPSHTSDQYSTYSLSKETASASLQTTWLSPSSGGVQTLSPLAVPLNSGGSPFYTANNSPAYYSASSVDGSSKRAPFMPAKSCLSGYSDHPSYMAYTESSKAKARSFSAPKQRPQWERSSCSQWERSNSVNRYSVMREREKEIETTLSAQKMSASFGTRAYQGSGRLDKYGMPVRDVSGFSGGLWHRY